MTYFEDGQAILPRTPQNLILKLIAIHPANDFLLTPSTKAPYPITDDNCRAEPITVRQQAYPKNWFCVTQAVYRAAGNSFSTNIAQ